MAENPGLENHRIKSFKNKGRDVEASVLRVCSGRAAGRGGEGPVAAGSRRLAVSRSWPPPRGAAARAAAAF